MSKKEDKKLCCPAFKKFNEYITLNDDIQPFNYCPYCNTRFWPKGIDPTGATGKELLKRLTPIDDDIIHEALQMAGGRHIDEED